MTSQQAIGRGFRGIKTGQVNCFTAGSGGKTVMDGDLQYKDGEYSIVGAKLMENNDIHNVEYDYIGELLVDTRNYDVDEEDMGIVLMDSSVISLKGGITDELRFKEILSAEHIPELIEIDNLDECEVDIGIFRYVFGFIVNVAPMFISEGEELASNHPQLISKHQYPYSDEEFLDKEYNDE